MKLNESLEPFKETIYAIQRILAKFDNRGVIIGGIAASFLGKPRFTEDVDAVFMLSTEDISSFLEVAKAEKIVPRIEKVEEFARKTRVLLLIHSPSNKKVDISLGVLPFEEEMVERAQVKTVKKLSVRLPTPEDLIIMKAIAHRPKDLEDIRGVVDAQATLDLKHIELWVKAFGELLETPDLWKQIEEILKR